jgi:hypothetical protein
MYKSYLTPLIEAMIVPYAEHAKGKRVEPVGFEQYS